ncbi:dTMP kinase [Microbacterium suaedae]|uniref:dTMP kinase n=1 Tax=Microbacterium suaedae TaxID=2067813 RepID=UPI000DA136DD|nr:dTMP kinase [Microbacterium suaedae]
MPRGLWITFEGGDGSGKTTQAELLRAWCEQRGRRVVRTREPGGTEVGRTIREIVLHHRGDIGARAEALLFAADRSHHVRTVVSPAIERGEIVIQDRYLDSSVAYQGAARDLGPDEVRELSLWATEGALPDVTVLLDLDPGAARARLDADDKPFDRLEAEKADFHARVRDAYLRLAADEPGRFLVLDASLPVDEIASRIRDRVASHI